MDILADDNAPIDMESRQQNWKTIINGASALFAGHPLLAVAQERDGETAFELQYLGFYARGFDSLPEAQACGKAYVCAVLDMMRDFVDPSSSPAE